MLEPRKPSADFASGVGHAPHDNPGLRHAEHDLGICQPPAEAPPPLSDRRAIFFSKIGSFSVNDSTTDPFDLRVSLWIRLPGESFRIAIASLFALACFYIGVFVQKKHSRWGVFPPERTARLGVGGRKVFIFPFTQKGYSGGLVAVIFFFVARTF